MKEAIKNRKMLDTLKTKAKKIIPSRFHPYARLIYSILTQSKKLKKKIDPLIEEMKRERDRFACWVDETLKLHAPYGLPQREFMLKENHLFLKSNYGVWFAYVPGFGLRHLEMNGTNDRVQIQFILNNIPEDAVFFDIGASYGYYSMTIAKEKPGATVHAFEPSRRSQEYFLLNLWKNLLNNVYLVPSAVGNNNGIVSGVGSIDDFGVSYIRPFNKDNYYKLEAITLDTYVAQKEIDSLNYIKIDIEGGELLAIRGAVQSIQRFRPIGQCELDECFSQQRFGYSCDEIFKLMENMGYNYFFLPKRNYLYEFGKLILGERNVQDALRQSSEFFFVPREKMNSINLENDFSRPVKFPYAV